MNHIDKEIFKQADVSKRLRRLNMGYWICAAVGVVCSMLYYAVSSSAILLLLAVVGNFSLLVGVCYYLFGDSRGAYYKPGRCFLSRGFDYYPLSMREAVLSALDDADPQAVSRVKKGTNPELVLVTYADDDGRVEYRQLLEAKGNDEVPISQIYFINNKNV